MDEHRTERRDFLKRMTALGAAVVPMVAGVRARLARAGQAQGESGMNAAYDPTATFELKVSEVEFRRTPAGRQLMARVYQPQGA